MFGRRKKVDEWTPADHHFYDLWLAQGSKKTVLANAARNVIIMQKAVELYPPGPDKDKAKQEAETAQHSLLCAIEAYDGNLQDLKRFNRSNLKHCADWVPEDRFISSHMIITIAVNNFYAGRL